MKTPLEEYHDFIDTMVALREDRIKLVWIKESGWPDMPENVEINQLLAQLTRQQRDIVAEIYLQGRDGAIHDALLHLENYTLISEDGITLPTHSERTLMKNHFFGRIYGEPWDVL